MARKKRPPNLILLITDQQRAVQHWPDDPKWLDQLTPNDALLRATGVDFTRAFTATWGCRTVARVRRVSMLLTCSPHLKAGDSCSGSGRIGEFPPGGSRFIAPAYFTEGSPRCHDQSGRENACCVGAYVHPTNLSDSAALPSRFLPTAKAGGFLGGFDDEETIRVPLVFSNPVCFSKPAQTDTLASLIDLVPTFLGIAGASSEGRLDGCDLSPVLAELAEACEQSGMTSPPLPALR